MASTYTAAGIELITTGEQSGTWGATTNTNLELIEELAVGVVSIALSGTTYTLTTSDGVSSDGRHAVVVFTGTPGGTCTVTISPNDMQKVYFVKNDSNQTVTLTQGSGGNVNVAAGDSAIVYCDGAGAGAAVVDFTSTFNFASYADTTANFTGTLQNGGSNVVVDSDIGSTVQAYDADLTALGGLAKTDGNFIVGDGSTWVAESGATARTSLGLGSLATANTISNADWSGTDLSVANGGTGASSFTANNVLLGNGTSAFQVVAPGTSGNVLTSNGTTWTSAAAGGSMVYPGAGIAVSTGSAWDTSKTAPTGTIVGTSDTQTLTNKTITDLVFDGEYTEEVFTISDGASVDLDPSNGTVQLWTLGASRTPTATNFAAGQSITLMVDDGASAYTITWPSVTWVNNGGSAPTLATSGYTVVALWKVSTTLYGALVGDGT